MPGIFPRPAQQAVHGSADVQVAPKVEVICDVGADAEEVRRIGTDAEVDLMHVTGAGPEGIGVPVSVEIDAELDIRDGLGIDRGAQTEFQREEGYVLAVRPDRIVVTAAHPAGLRHGVQSLLQLLRAGESRDLVQVQTIRDVPRMPVRGQMLDVGRKYLPVDVLRREIRRMAWWKMNELHLHLTEWNGFRIGSEVLPGVASPEHYTLTELRELDAYAQRWGVTLMPEIEVPGHAVWLSRYDERLRLCSRAMDIAGWPGGQAGGWMLDVTSKYVRDTVKALLTELCEVFSSEVIHIGGDELPTQRFIDETPELHAYAAEHGLEHPGDVLVEFQNDLAAHLATLGRRAEIWEWWAFGDQIKSIAPDRDIRVLKWLDDHPPTYWAEQGWETIGANWNRNFCTPGYGTVPGAETRQGFEGYMPAEKNYEEDHYPHGRNALGYRLSRWMDKAEHQSYDWLDFHAGWAMRTIAERTWSLAGDVDAVSAFERADAVGPYPGDGHDSELVTLPRSAIRGIDASSEETDSFDGRAAHLVDRDRRTTWSSRTTADLALPPHRLTLHLAQEHLIGGVELVPRQDGGKAADYHDSQGVPRDVVILAGDRPDALHEVARGTLTQALIAQRLVFEPLPARTVRVEILTDHGNLMLAALSEIRLLAAPRRNQERS